MRELTERELSYPGLSEPGLSERAPGGAPSEPASMVGAARDAIIARTLEGVITDWNPGAVRLYGYQPHEVLGRSGAILLPPGRGNEEDAVLAAVTTGAVIERYRTERVRKDGSLVTVAVTVSPVIDATGRLSGVASVSRAAGVDEAASTGAALLDAVPDAVVAIDAAGRLVYANAPAERMFGYLRDELLGRPVELLVPTELRERHAGHRNPFAWHVADRPPGSPDGRLTAQRKDGSRFPVDISLRPLPTGEGPLIAAAISDATERVADAAERDRLRTLASVERLARRRAQAQRLEGLGQLAGHVAHDFNNLLAVIVNYADFVAAEAADASAEDPDRWTPVLRDVEQIQRAAERGIELARQLLDFDRRGVARPRLMSVNELIGEVRPRLAASLGGQLELECRLAPDAWPVFADPVLLEQVLANLAGNARDAMDGAGLLMLHTDNVVVSAEEGDVPAGRYLRLRVTDAGAGMPPEVLARALEPLYSTKSKGLGAGLGLPTVYGIVTELGGDVQLRSEVGRGTCVTVLLPAADPAT